MTHGAEDLLMAPPQGGGAGWRTDPVPLAAGVREGPGTSEAVTAAR